MRRNGSSDGTSRWTRRSQWPDLDAQPPPRPDPGALSRNRVARGQGVWKGGAPRPPCCARGEAAMAHRLRAEARNEVMSPGFAASDVPTPTPLSSSPQGFGRGRAAPPLLRPRRSRHGASTPRRSAEQPGCSGGSPGMRSLQYATYSARLTRVPAGGSDRERVASVARAERSQCPAPLPLAALPSEQKPSERLPLVVQEHVEEALGEHDRAEATGRLRDPLEG